MPKIRRKRRVTTSSRLARPPKKSAVGSAPVLSQPEKAKYFDLIAQPNESIKSKKTDNFIQSPKLPRNLKVPIDWDVKAGDVISWSEGRPTETFFVTTEGTLLKNPDTSGSGYLTIPLSITSQYPDALEYFSAVLDGVGRSYASSVELQPTDAFFRSHFSKQPLPTEITNRTDLSYSFDPNDEVLNVTFGSESQQFPLDTTKTNDIIQWISSLNEPKGTLTVNFNFEGKEICSQVPRGIIAGLPKGWTCEQQGSLSFGENQIQGAWKCRGPAKTKSNAKKAIEKHYKGLHIEVV